MASNGIRGGLTPQPSVTFTLPLSVDEARDCLIAAIDRTKGVTLVDSAGNEMTAILRRLIPTWSERVSVSFSSNSSHGTIVTATARPHYKLRAFGAAGASEALKAIKRHAQETAERR